MSQAPQIAAKTVPRPLWVVVHQWRDLLTKIGMPSAGCVTNTGIAREITIETGTMTVAGNAVAKGNKIYIATTSHIPAETKRKDTNAVGPANVVGFS